jgi:hypothetical protein
MNCSQWAFTCSDPNQFLKKEESIEFLILIVRLGLYFIFPPSSHLHGLD